MAAKLLLCALVIALGGALGYYTGRKYVIREKILSDFMALCGYMRNNISFLHTPLEPMLAEYSDKVSPHTKMIFDSFIASLKEGGEVKDAVEKSARKELKEGDKELITKLLVSLGKYDPDGQAAALNGFEALFDESRKDAAELKKKYYPLCFKLGALAGAGLAILIL